VAVLFSILPLSFGQSQPPSDPQAITLASQSIALITGGTPITDVTLTGTATWISGIGTGTLMARGISESRVNLTSSSGNRTEIRNNSGGSFQGQWVDPDGSTGLYVMHNCMVDPVWFFPALSSLSDADRNTVFSYVGAESHSGVAVQHIRTYHYSYSKSAATMALTQQLSTVDFYLDTATSLPVAIQFNVHPDDDASTAIPIEVDFYGYQMINGIQIPMHVQQSVRNNLALDFVVTSEAVNSGLPEGYFTIQ